MMLSRAVKTGVGAESKKVSMVWLELENVPLGGE